jgi:hypothetical protein
MCQKLIKLPSIVHISKTTEAIRTILVSYDRSRRMLINGLNAFDL